MTREELIAALEKATGADRALDVDIALAVHAWPEGVFPMRAIPGQIGLDGGRCVSASPYTDSIDAALTLVPEGGEWSRYRAVNGKMTISVETDVAIFGSQGQGANDAISMCIAALKAQEGGA